MYYPTHQTTSSTVINRRLHTPKTTHRPFMIRFSLMFTIMLIIFSVGAMVQANAGPVVKGTQSSISQLNPTAAAATTISVEQGDTLWSIAEENAPKGTNIRSYIDQIRQLNRLTGAALRVGERLLLP